VKRIAILATLLALSPFRLNAQTTAEEEKLFSEENSEEQFFKLEEDAVTIASKHAQSTREAPATITVLTAEDIFRYGLRDMSDVLRSAAGWFVSDGHDFVYAGVRGILLKGDQNSRILVMIDGHSMNEQWSSTSSIDEALGLDIAAIARVEILQGPSSTLYGTNAFLGIINIVTKSAADSPSLFGQLELGSFERSRLTAAKNGKVGELAYGARASVIGESGRSLYFPERSTSSSSAGFTSPAADALQSLQASGRVQFKGFQLQGLYTDRLKHVPTAPFDTALNDPRTYYRQKRWFVEVKLNRSLSSRINLMARLYYDGFRFEDYLMTNDPDPALEPYPFRDFGTDHGLTKCPVPQFELLGGKVIGANALRQNVSLSANGHFV
jgi:iron complex outermembrane receptor protein